AGLKERPARNNPKKAEAGEKAKERVEERAKRAADAEAAAAEAAAAPAEEPVAETEADEAAAEQAPAETADVPAEEPVAEEAAAGAHGVKGEVRLKLFSDSVESLSAHESLYVGGASRRLVFVRDGGKTAVARFEGISDRSAVEALRGSLVEVDRSALPALEDG